MRKTLIISLLCLAAIVSCKQESYRDEVAEALRLAGNNAPELLKVLEHYRGQNRQKYEAARFLIANMPHHRSQRELLLPEEYKGFFVRLDSVYHAVFDTISGDFDYQSKKYDAIRKLVGDLFNALPAPQYQPGKEDVETVKGNFLIASIDQAFEQWEQSKFAEEISYDDFLECMLPYRMRDEPLAFSKEELYRLFNHVDLIGEISVPKDWIENFIVYVERMRWLLYHAKSKGHIGVYDLFLLEYAVDCYNITTWTTNLLRACGLPAVYDFTAQWQGRARKHYWCSAPDSMGIFLPFTPPDNNLMEDYESNLKHASKVYRYTYEVNKETPYFLCHKSEYIPKELSTPLIKDVTFRYHQTVTLRLPLEVETENKVAYLSLFSKDDYNQTAVAWGRVNGKEGYVEFEQVPLNIVFFPVLYNEEGYTPLSAPFMLKTDTIVKWLAQPFACNKLKSVVCLTVKNDKLYLKNTEITDIEYIAYKRNKQTQLTTVKVFRKFPIKEHFQENWNELKDAVIVTGQKGNKVCDTLGRLLHPAYPYLQEIKLNNHKKYRYYRFSPTLGRRTHMAHIEFLAEYSPKHTCVKPSPLPQFTEEKLRPDTLWTIIGEPLKTGSNPEYAFDYDLETCVGASTLGLDFKIPVCIKAVRLFPRSGYNIIMRGDEYAFYYYDKGGWVLHEIQKATANYLVFKNVPSGLIYWLENRTQGKEEHPFVMKDGEQQFINIPH